MRVKLAFFSLLLSASCAALAAANAEVLGQSDDSVYGLIGLSPVLSFNCVGVNAGVWYIAKRTSYRGNITINAFSNAAAAQTSVVQTSISLTQPSASRPGAGTCTLSGVINPSPEDYLLSLSSSNDIAFIPGNATNVVNPSSQLVPASTHTNGNGMWADFLLASGTPFLEADNSLTWRIGMKISFDSFREVGFQGYRDGGYKTQSAATATVSGVIKNSDF